MVRTTATALLALAATVSLTTAWPEFRRAPGVVTTIADSQPQASWSTITPVSTQVPAPSAAAKKYKYVLTFSADGLHSSDIGKYVAIQPQSTIASLLETGCEYSDAYTSAVSCAVFEVRTRSHTDLHSRRTHSQELWPSLRAQALPLTVCGMTILGTEAGLRREATALDHLELTVWSCI